MKKNNGLTIIEGVIAISILLICVLGIINIYPWSLKISKSAELKTIATNLAQEKIEELMALDYDEIGQGTIETRHRLGPSSVDPFYQFERETVVSLVDGDLNDSASDQGMKKINITVYWSTQLGGNENVEMTGLISQL